MDEKFREFLKQGRNWPSSDTRHLLMISGSVIIFASLPSSKKSKVTYPSGTFFIFTTILWSWLDWVHRPQVPNYLHGWFPTCTKLTLLWTLHPAYPCVLEVRVPLFIEPILCLPQDLFSSSCVFICTNSSFTFPPCFLAVFLLKATNSSFSFNWPANPNYRLILLLLFLEKALHPTIHNLQPNGPYLVCSVKLIEWFLWSLQNIALGFYFSTV